MMAQLDVLTIAIQAVVGAISTGTLGCLIHFVRKQNKVNKANAMANRAMQRDVLFRYFHSIVEEGNSTITPEEYEHLGKCYEAYHENEGNGTGTLMWNKIQENVRLDTGRN